VHWLPWRRIALNALARHRLGQVDHVRENNAFIPRGRIEDRLTLPDPDLIETACRIQREYELKSLTTKYVLKRAARGLLPPDIIHRRKAGFMMPVALWLTEQMRNTIEDLCSPAAIARTELFDASFIRQILDEHFQLRRDHWKHIYALLCFMAWFHNYAT
jgi:asparagine synthase (glutamine-hydrolysing)